ELAEQANNPLLRGKALTNLAGNFHQLGFTSRSFLARLAPVLEILPPTHDKLMLLLRSAELHRHLGKIETAFSRLQAARQLSEILENPHALPVNAYCWAVWRKPTGPSRITGAAITVKCRRCFTSKPNWTNCVIWCLHAARYCAMPTFWTLDKINSANHMSHME
ncbi:MAG: hypothetical protein GY862_18665, partial [Gammaproteobacteria bacterium]|nr:hypothetical protein [Gammaproteobacteria bacterium]